MKRTTKPEPAPTEEEIRRERAPLVRRSFRRVIGPIRTAARERGYAIAVHGSLARDIDLIAAPWTERASSAHELVEAVVLAIRDASKGLGYFKDDPFHALTGEKKPHGRRAWSIYIDGTYIDLSVMPRSSP